jgi:hypothetical protein
VESLFARSVLSTMYLTDVDGEMQRQIPRHCEPTGRANARPMTGSAKQSMEPQAKMDCFVAIAPRNDELSAQDGWSEAIPIMF